jgi:predicted ATPase/DNA-binding winged helix-turn-helix (wHTH) protein
MPDAKNSALAFGPFRLFAAERRLEKEGRAVPLGGRAFDLLVVLVERAGEIVPRRTLMDSVWRDVNVEEASLRFHVKELRKALGDSRPDRRYVRNVPGRGYCFVAPIERLAKLGEKASGNEPFKIVSDLPGRASPIVGRSGNIETLTRELSKRRLVTIAGPGGIGKTTLAVATAERLRSSFANGVLFVDLAPIADPSLVVGALLAALGVAMRADDPLSGVIDFLRNKQTLIVIDNCEQVIETVATLVDRILRETDGAHILATSRETLQIAGERVHRLMPLECPPLKAEMTLNEAMSYPAVQLFVDRATAIDEDFLLNEELAPAAAKICQRLDGIPLAIELAAAQVEFFGVDALAKALHDMFAVLTRGRRLALPRHQTLRAALDWSYNLLSPTEQTVLRRIATFRAPFTLESAIEVAAGSELSTADAIEAMAGLFAKSMLAAESAAGATQYRLLETTRLYASEKLTSSGEGSRTARRHAEHFLALFASEPNDRGFNSDAAPPPYAKRIDDVRAALEWSFSDDGDQLVGMELLAASSQLWFRLTLNIEYRRRIELALQKLSEWPESSPLVEMRLQIALGHTLWNMQSDLGLMERTFARAQELVDRMEQAPSGLRLQALWGLWVARRGTGRHREALVAAERYQAVARSAGDPSFILLGDRTLALTHHFLGNQALARDHAERVRRIAQSSNYPPTTAFQISSRVAAETLLARIRWLQGFPDQAMTALREAIDEGRRSSNQHPGAYVLTFAGCPLSMWTGNLSETQEFLDILADIGAKTGSNILAGGLMRCWALILRLRKGDDRDALIASYLEPRLDLPTVQQTLALASASTIPLPAADDDAGDALWCLPEVLRVNAELLLWRDEPGAAAPAEAKLLRSIDIAREQTALSWELRAATSLARLWSRSGRAAQARELLVATYGRFTEGFETSDLLTARRLIAELS